MAAGACAHDSCFYCTRRHSLRVGMIPQTAAHCKARDANVEAAKSPFRLGEPCDRVLRPTRRLAGER
eukprot:scaffold16864_cov53-Phaeocystis_antarctica.AAC.1